LPTENKSAFTPKPRRKILRTGETAKKIKAVRQKILFSRLFKRKKFTRRFFLSLKKEMFNDLKENFMMKLKRIETIFCLLLIAMTALASACSMGRISAQKTASQQTAAAPTESPTPGYKPLKRVSRDVLDSDKKEEPAKNKTKK
jgi:hypothetical protein